MNLEKRKRERKELADRYWKLSSNERMEYDLKRDKLNCSLELNLTKLFLIFVTFFFVYVYGVIYYFGNGIISFKEITTPLFLGSLKLIGILLIMDLLIFVFISFNELYQIKKLNQRFKLIKYGK